MALKETQARLDDIEDRLVKNKQSRQKSRAEARELREEYFEVEKEREKLLKEEFESKQSEGSK